MATEPDLRAVALARQLAALAEADAVRVGLFRAARPEAGTGHVDLGTNLLDEFRRDFADETRGQGETVAAVQPSLLRVGDVERTHGPRHSHVAEPSLLLESRRFPDGALVRKQAVLHTA